MPTPGSFSITACLNRFIANPFNIPAKVKSLAKTFDPKRRMMISWISLASALSSGILFVFPVNAAKPAK